MKKEIIKDELLDIKEDIEYVQGLLAMPDDNYKQMYTCLAAAITKIDILMEDLKIDKLQLEELPMGKIPKRSINEKLSKID